MYAWTVGFDWDEDNIDHILLHGVREYEVEEVFFSNPLEFPGRSVGGEQRFLIVGASDCGRILNVVWTLRDGKVRPITAYDSTGRYRQSYKQRPKG